LNAEFNKLITTGCAQKNAENATSESSCASKLNNSFGFTSDIKCNYVRSKIFVFEYQVRYSV